MIGKVIGNTKSGIFYTVSSQVAKREQILN